MSYLALKWLHLIGASVLLGTGAGIAFFAWFGYRQAMHAEDLGLLRGILRLTVTADFVFTATAAAIQPISGLGLWHLAGGSWRSHWLWSVLALYVFIGACWLPVVWLQLRLRDLAIAAPSTARLDPSFHALFRSWFVLGVPAFIAVLVLYALMLWRW